MSKKKCAMLGGGLMLLACFTVLSGCGGDGHDRRQVSGTVTYDGKPVPRGSIWFEPDPSLGNTAPTGFAVIQDGQYKSELARSPIAGKYQARILGFDGVVSEADRAEWDADGEPPGEPLFKDYVTPPEEISADGKWDIEISK
ncbi:MAG: hypothetical protein WDZ51_14115 [Pirellulaceae bacterium]